MSRKRIPPKVDREHAAFVLAVVELKDRAGRLGLWRTMHAFREVERAFGKDLDPVYADNNADWKRHCAAQP